MAMTRQETDLFKINGNNMLTPDEDMGMSFEDIDSPETGRNEQGVMKRFVVRYKVGSWSFSYNTLSEEEYRYMESIFPDSGDFNFTHPDRVTGAPTVTKCYRSKCSIAWKNARTGKWKNYQFNIIEM